MGGARRRDRGDGPEGRLDPRARVRAVVQAVGLHGARHDQGARRARPDDGQRAEEELPVARPRPAGPLSARLDLQAGHRARGDAGAHALALRVQAVHGDVQRAGGQVAPHVPQLGPEREPADGPADGARVLVRHVLLPTRQPVLRAAGGPRPAAPEVGRGVRLRQADRDGRRPRGERARADDRLEAHDVHEEERSRPLRRSTASGRRATRSSSRSARATCS